MHVEPFPEYDIALSLEMNPKIAIEDPVDLSELDPTEFTPNAPPSLEGLNADVKETRLYFGSELFGNSLGDMKPWAVGEAPVLMGPRAPADPDMKQTAAAPATAEPGVTVAGKGEVTGEDRRPKSPAERLNLSGAKRAKAEKCLANAVYFESRSEPVRGQIAVAQVVMNRAFSGYLPERRLRRRVPERAPPSRLPVHLRVRRHSGRRQRSGVLDARASASRARRSTASCGCPRSPRRRTTMRPTCIPIGCARCARTPRSGCITSIARANGATARTRPHGAARPIRRMPRRGCDAKRCYISISSATSRLGAECVIAPDER